LYSTLAAAMSSREFEQHPADHDRLNSQRGSAVLSSD
jgi:hypothetical protein